MLAKHFAVLFRHMIDEVLVCLDPQDILGDISVVACRSKQKGHMEFCGLNLAVLAIGDIDAGRIVAQERDDRVIFSGDVVVSQAGLKVRADRMQLNYLNATTLEIQRITATGGVSVERGRERATGTTGVYDFDRRVITLVGDVRLQQGESTLSGGRLVIDLDTGISSVDGQASGGAGAPAGSETGRVRGTFAVPQGDGPSDEQPEE